MNIDESNLFVSLFIKLKITKLYNIMKCELPHAKALRLPASLTMLNFT